MCELNVFQPYKRDFSNEIIFYKIDRPNIQFRFKIKDEEKFLFIANDNISIRYRELYCNGLAYSGVCFFDQQIKEVDLEYELLCGESKVYNLECPLLEKLLKSTR